MAEHKHREEIYREGSGRKVKRCASCFKEMGEVEGSIAAAPQPEPVEAPKASGR
jgi:hypothetical protein